MDVLHTFLFEGMPVRGMLVRLDDAWQEVLARRARSESGAWPEPVQHLLGEMMAAVALLHANIKFDGTVTLQMLGGAGPVRLAVAEAQPGLGLRATAKVVGEVGPQADFAALLNAGGAGRCAITLAPRDPRPGQQPWQGVVPLSDAHGRAMPTLAAALEHYMDQSEQLDTRVVLAADARVAAGLLIQRLPRAGAGNLGRGTEAGDADEDFNRLAHLSATLTAGELLGLDPEVILRRLFWEEPHRRFEPRVPRFACTCSLEKVAGMLRSLGEAEVQDIVAEQGAASVHCDFCGKGWRFDPVDAATLFVTPTHRAPGSGSVQ